MRNSRTVSEICVLQHFIHKKGMLYAYSSLVTLALWGKGWNCLRNYSCRCIDIGDKQPQREWPWKYTRNLIVYNNKIKRQKWYNVWLGMILNRSPSFPTVERKACLGIDRKSAYHSAKVFRFWFLKAKYYVTEIRFIIKDFKFDIKF